MEELFKGENLQLDYSEEGALGVAPALLLGSDDEQWYVLGYHKAKALRDALNDGIRLMEEKEDGAQ